MNDRLNPDAPRAHQPPEFFAHLNSDITYHSP
jgi:hypothetical protein